ncbi:hypothetical protein FNF31_01260 [Cafeteria roenbergensis]|uniref:Uncharacterized protein n=1 Tax=Cafeteria roenbergensis TaxID=33653 RepID=A0A5A8DNA4_CAFRO|nr:hypothetical protein FNF31_01260 [Cafeteria roenbergensis]
MPTSDGSTGWTPPYEYDPSSDTPYPIWLTDPEGPTYRFILGLAEQSASLLQAAHEATGLPWWATIVVGTAAARAAFLPLQMYAIRNASRAFDAREDMGRLVAAHRAALQRLGPAASPMERLAATRVLIRGMQAALHDANCYPWRTFAVPFLQIPAAVLAVLGARHLVLLGDESFETGGALWFTDLTVADSTYALPVVCVGLTYAFLEYVFRKPRDGGAVVGGAALLSDTLMRRFKSGLQLWTLMAIPLSSTMPAGLYMGWLTGTLYGFAYVTTIRTDAVHALITGRTASRYRAGGDGGGDDLFDLPGITGGAGGDDAAAQDAAGVAGAGVLSIEPGRAAASAAAAARQAREGADADVASRSRLLLEGDPDSRGGLADPERRQQPMSPEDERHMAELKERIDEWLVRDPSAGDFDDFELGHLESADDAVVEHWLDKATRSEWHTHMDKAARADPVRFGSWESRALEHARQSGDAPLRKMPPTAGRIRPRTAAAASATGPASRTARQRRFQLGQQQAASHQQAQAQTRAGRLAATPLATRPHGDGVSLPQNPAAAAVTGAARAAATVVARGGKVLGGAVRSALSDASGAVSASPAAAAAATPASLGGATSRRGGSGVVDGAATASDRLARQRDAAPRAASKPDAAGSDDGAVGDRDAAADAAAAAALERAKQRLLAGTSGPSARGARSRFALTPGTPRRSDGSVSFPLPSTMEGTLSERRAAASARASAADGSAPGSDPGSSGATSLEEEPAHTVMSVLHEASLRDSGAALPRSSAGGPVLGVSYGSRELRLAAWQRRTRAAARDAAHVAAARSAPARPAPAQHATKAGARVALAQRLKNASSSREAADLAMARLRAVARGETPRTAADIAATLGGSDPSDAPAPRLESAIAGMRDSLIRSAEALKAASAKAVAAGGSSGASDDGGAAGASAGDATGAGPGGSSSGGSGSGRGSGWLGSVLNWFGAGTKAAARAESAPAPASPAEAAAGTGSPQAGADSAEPAASQAAEPPKAPRRPAQPTDEELRSASSDCFSAWRGGGRAAASPSGRGSRVIVVDEDSDEHAAGPSPAASAEQDGSRPEVLRSRKVGGAAGDGGGDGDQSGAAAGAGAGERRASLIDGSGRVISSAVSGAIRSEGTHADADHEAWRGGGPAAGAGVPSWDAHHRTEASDRGTASLASAASAAVAGRRRQAAANASAARRPAAKEAGRRAAGTAPADEDWSTANLGDVLRSALADADDPSGTTDAESEDLLSGFDDMDGDGDDAAGRIGAQRSEHRMVKEERSITTAPIDALRLAPGRVGGVGFLPVVPLSRLMAGQGPVRGEQPLAAALRPPNGGTPPTPIPISAQHHLEMSRNGFTHLPEPGQEQDLLAGVREELKAISEQESSQGFEHAGGRVRRLQRELQNLIRDERRRGGGGGGGRGGGGSGASGGGDRR